MLLTAHITVGAAIGSTIGNPVLAVITSFVSHYLLNCIPHWDLKPVQGKFFSRVIFVGDIILSIIMSLLFSIFIPAFINHNNGTTPEVYPFTIPTNIIGNLAFSPTVLLCCVASVLPMILELPEVIAKKKLALLNWNTKLLKYMHQVDNKVMGKIVQLATIIVFSLYSFRLLPNSDSPVFLQIILMMLIIVGILAIMETFMEER